VSCGGEDSSYDSDYEAEDLASHQDVSRTTSDTLGAEFAEYVSGPQSVPSQPLHQVSAGVEQYALEFISLPFPEYIQNDPFNTILQSKTCILYLSLQLLKYINPLAPEFCFKL
jgi:hypothetical protein